MPIDPKNIDNTAFMEGLADPQFSRINITPFEIGVAIKVYAEEILNLKELVQGLASANKHLMETVEILVEKYGVDPS